MCALIPHPGSTAVGSTVPGGTAVGSTTEGAAAAGPVHTGPAEQHAMSTHHTHVAPNTQGAAQSATAELPTYTLTRSLPTTLC